MPFPTAVHERAASAVVDFFSTSAAQAVLLLNSCARGTATASSDLDVAVLVARDLARGDRRELDRERSAFRSQSAPVRHLEESGAFTKLHLDVIDGVYEPQMWDDGGGPDDFEVEVGNLVA